jgi:RNA polymerase sigma factor (sigma-70 family)
MRNEDVLSEMLDDAADRLAAYGYLLTGSPHAGEELAQAAIVKVFVKRGRLDNARAAEGYVRAAMRTVHIDGLRRDKVWRRIMPGQAATRTAPDPAAQIASHDAMAQAMVQLSPQERAVIVLRYFDDLALSTVADQMGLATGTVKRYHSNALDKLRGAMGDPDLPDARVVVAEKGQRT